jgi:predicted RNA-binding Zn ribbon-like protein
VSDEDAGPPSARLLRDFVNTYEPQIDDESLGSPEDLSEWLHERGLLDSWTPLRSADLTAAVTFREGLRVVFLGHAGHETDPAPLSKLEKLLAGIPVRLSLAGGWPALLPVRDRPVDRALAVLIEAIRQCAEDGSWGRLKVCDRATCRWAFYDASRNQARRWCSMAGCGNHIKMRRAYATRRGRPVPG